MEIESVVFTNEADLSPKSPGLRDEQSDNEDRKDRNLKLLDKMLGSLKYLKRFNEQIRLKIYKHAELISLPG